VLNHHNASSELNVRLVQREPNVPHDLFSNSSSHGVNESLRLRDHNHRSDEWKFRDRSRRFVENQRQ
jgi:hypothetical protein